MKKKIMIGAIVGLVVSIIMISVLLVSPKQEQLSVEAYQSRLTQLINGTRSGQEKWNQMMQGADGEGIAFTDLCTSFYATEFRQLGTEFMTKDTEFKTLKMADGNPEAKIQGFATYGQYFATYRQIGETMITFADRIDAGEYKAGITQIEQMMAQYEQLPLLY